MKSDNPNRTSIASRTSASRRVGAWSMRWIPVAQRSRAALAGGRIHQLLRPRLRCSLSCNGCPDWRRNWDWSNVRGHRPRVDAISTPSAASASLRACRCRWPMRNSPACGICARRAHLLELAPRNGIPFVVSERRNRKNGSAQATGMAPGWNCCEMAIAEYALGDRRRRDAPSITLSEWLAEWGQGSAPAATRPDVC